MLLKTWISPQLGIVFNLSITHTIRNYSFLPIIINNYSHHNLASLHSSKLSLFSFQGAITNLRWFVEFRRGRVFRYTTRRKTQISQILVGSSGLEPPTSRLSGVRSNHLSYAPNTFLVEMRRIELLTPCLQSRCSPSWATPPYAGTRYSIVLF